MSLPFNLVGGTFEMPGADQIASVFATVRAAHPELKLGLDSQPHAKAAILSNFRHACEFIAEGYSAPAATSNSAADWARKVNDWAYSTGRGSATVSADLFTAAAIALNVPMQSDSTGTFFSFSDGSVLQGGRQLRFH